MLLKKSGIYIGIIVLIGCLIMAWIDAILMPNYAVKSAIKLVLFILLPLIYAKSNKQVSLRDLFILKPKAFLYSLMLGFIVYISILGAYFLLGPYFDFSNITKTLENNIGVNKSNFVFVAIYISIINSFLEEFFFRGFAFLTLKRVTSRKFAYIFSATAFSLYHVAIMTNWFTPGLFILLIASLFFSGLLFNWLNEKSGTIYSSWLVHMCANLAINTVGFMLFEIL
ncbi:CPBP family intramembrane glutamic endopeptidase [Serpentinicella sp. ANB-PHB4]|uniref:CPBP family intramembrane glutamic endopeptidase n=1 Tax=Serpentinicella sp. ANB-PHB4 TaxID=3074076 RepID=UPI00285AC9C3|nr:CPBP family intramembrane glutamic endopeptidase [Serpentinicella sp. ANB-PHB4]MDR5660009.1 CPBP family intramembrane glutamic endopeptidase [Serpentinicella sp. ANB-PHB4]